MHDDHFSELLWKLEVHVKNSDRLKCQGQIIQQKQTTIMSPTTSKGSPKSKKTSSLHHKHGHIKLPRADNPATFFLSLLLILLVISTNFHENLISHYCRSSLHNKLRQAEDHTTDWMAPINATPNFHWWGWKLQKKLLPHLAIIICRM